MPPDLIVTTTSSLVATWWKGANGDHLYENCPCRQRSLPELTRMGWDRQGRGEIDPTDATVCGWCSRVWTSRTTTLGCGDRRGTTAGYHRHRRRHQDACAECKQAAAAVRRARRSSASSLRRRSANGDYWPHYLARRPHTRAELRALRRVVALSTATGTVTAGTVRLLTGAVWSDAVDLLGVLQADGRVGAPDRFGRHPQSRDTQRSARNGDPDA